MLQTDLPLIKTFMSNCPTVTADWEITGNWFKYWKSQGMLVYSTAYHNAMQHMDTVKADVAKITADYDSRDYYTAAADASTLAKLLLPVPAEMEMLDDQLPCPKGFKLTTIELADFVSGFMFGFTGHDDKTDMEKCFKDTP